MMKQPDFLHVDTNSWKFKVDRRIFVWVWSKIGFGHSGPRILKLTVLLKEINGIN